MIRTILYVCVLLCLCETGVLRSAEDPPAQPIPFSHKQHAAAGAACADCHTTAKKAVRAGMPDTARCLLCHRSVKQDSPAIVKLRKMHEDKEPVEWIRLYQVPDFVFFSHEKHLAAGAACSECHGPVEQREVLTKEVPTTMAACMNCHKKYKASVDCNLCHQLGQ